MTQVAFRSMKNIQTDIQTNMAQVQTDMAQVLHVHVVLTQAHPIVQNISSYKLSFN